LQAFAIIGAVPTTDPDLLGELRRRGLRMTPQRRAIVAEVMRAKGHISPTAIARTVQADMPGVNASTVYRTLTLLEQVGVLQHSHVETGAEYHRAEEAHHVHLTCRNCGRDDELSLEEAGRLRQLIRRHHGFEADLTHFAITGLCADCAAA
jgi:Fur family transcriptional regulator, ferric uptake regulator